MHQRVKQKQWECRLNVFNRQMFRRNYPVKIKRDTNFAIQYKQHLDINFLDNNSNVALSVYHTEEKIIYIWSCNSSSEWYRWKCDDSNKLYLLSTIQCALTISTNVTYTQQ